jgi:glycine cleavage system H protein
MNSSRGKYLKIEGYEILEDLYYSKDHEWIKVEQDQCRIGITDYAQKTLHEVVFAELPEVGRQIKKTENLANLESVKAVAEVYAPLSGKIMKVNDELNENPELVNKSPYDKGWIAIIQPSNQDEEIKLFMNTKKYSDFIKQLVSK